MYHPRKPDQIRGVFDSSAIFEGVSLNSFLMSGSDLTNNLVGVLMRFRKNAVAIISHVEQMFYQRIIETTYDSFGIKTMNFLSLSLNIV